MSNPQEMAPAAKGTLALLWLANKLRNRDFRKSGNMSDLNASVGLFYKGISGLPTSSQDYSVALDNLAKTLLLRFQKEGQRDDLDEAISLHKQALKLQPLPHPNRCTTLNNLATVLWMRSTQGGKRSDVDEAISLSRQALELFPSLHPIRSTSFIILANALLTRFQQGGPRDDLDEAISLHRQALKLQPSPHPDRLTSLTNLSNTLWTRFTQGGEKSDLDEAIDIKRQVLELRPSLHPLRPMSLNNLANVLVTRFKQGGQKSDLDEAIAFNRQALELRSSSHPNESTSEAQRSDLDEAIALNRQALKLQPSPHPFRSTSLNNLANALSTRFKQGGQRDDLDEAIDLHSQALELRPSPHPDRSASLNNLATQGGEKSDLDEAISLNRQTLEFFPYRPTSLKNLVNALSTRFKHGGERSDLDEAIALNRQALELEPSPHLNSLTTLATLELQPSPHLLRSASLTNLSEALLTRYRRGGHHRCDLNEAISLNRQALELFPSPHLNRSTSLNNLANLLLTRFKHGGQKNDLDEAIFLNEQALELFPSTHPNRSFSLNNLANALSNRFDQGGQKSDLDEAISLHRQALELRPSPHPLRSSSLTDLGIVLVRAHSSTDGNSLFLEEAMSSFSAAMHCPSQSPSKRLANAKSWIPALQALPQLAALSFDLQSRQEALSARSDGFARDASICAIQTGNLVKAIEFLEAGRSIFWSQSLSLRSPFDQLHDIKPQGPKLACKLRDIATALELGSYRNISVDISDNRKRLSLDQEASRLNRLNEEWEKGINEVRKLKGFEDFLRPRRLSALQIAASEYPVVILVANDDGSHCLILKSTSVHHIELPGLRTRELQNLVQLVRNAVSQSTIMGSSVESIIEDVTAPPGDTRMPTRVGNKLVSSDDVFKQVLKKLWDEVVKPVINFLKIEKSDSGKLPMLQWCPTGLFTFLPIHAAGCYDIKSSSECASDYFISSYIPTIGALLVHDSAPSTRKFKMTVVIQSAELPATETELTNIKRHVSGDALVTFGVPDMLAKIEGVASSLSNASIVHFACHGTQDRFKPLDSSLKLDDGLLRVSRIMKEKISNESLAFLCACETGKGDENLPDEAISLGASLLFSGFRRVIATMWEMKDRDGPTIADAFYEELFRGPDGKATLEPDITKSARALDVAVKKLRSSSPNVFFRRWQGGPKCDLDEAVSLHRQALKLQPSLHPNRLTSLTNLSNGLWTRFTQGCDKSDLDEAIDINVQVLELRPSPHPLRPNSLNNLENVLMTRFKQGGQKGDLDEAIAFSRQALELRPSSHSNQSTSLTILAHTLLIRFKQGGQRSDLDEAIALNRQALKLQPSPHPLRSTSLNNLANALSTRFKQGGQRDDLDEAIDLHSQALELRPSPHPDRSASLNNLATQGGEKSDLDEAISLNRQTLEFFPYRPTSLKNLVNALSTRFKHGGERSDLDEAIALNRQALELEPSPHLNSLTTLATLELQPSPHLLRSASLTNLSEALLTRYRRGGHHRCDLNEAISLNRQALELFPSPHLNRSTSLNNLANLLLTRFKHGGQKNDLDEAIFLNEQALELFPSTHPNRSFSLNNLANALSNRFDQGGQKSDLDEAISLHRQALELRPSPHPLRSSSLTDLGIVLVRAHSSTDGNSLFLEEAMSSFSAAMHCPSQSPSKRLANAKSWIPALQALPQLAALSFDLQSRQEALSARSDGFARDASICAIQTGDLVKAIELLEAGRSIFWSQSLSLRSPFDQLHDIKPQLARKLRGIATALELGSYRDISVDISDNRKRLSLDQEASRLNRFNEEWEKGINEVRKLEGFEDFLRLSPFSLLQKAASAYPVVILVANDNGSHCLILTSTSIHHIDIPSLPTSGLQDLVRLVQAAASQMTISRSSIDTIMGNVTALLGETRGLRLRDNQLRSSDDIFKFVLGILWDEVVKPVVSLLKIEKSYSRELPVLQWCPTGAFTFLPIHAGLVATISKYPANVLPIISSFPIYRP
ncbi:TPR-like protein [Phlegmacium glaucopus]|nr:TPR-like protein [Phlegmacium glaucopus]